jgi:acyl-CoA synthetase (NDP forming)
MSNTAADIVRTAFSAGRASLTEQESKALLAHYGVPVPSGGLVASEAAAVETARRLGGKVAMKAVGSQIQHKTEGGLVVLGITGDEAVAETYRLLQERAGTALEAVLVEKMIAGNRELLVGLKRDRVFGPVVAFGLGGVMTEVFKDIALARVPLADRDVTELLDSIRATRILGAFRGAPAVDRAALSSIIRAVAQIAVDFPEIAEIDINPLLVEGGTPVAADALVILEASGADAGAAAPKAGGRGSRTFPLDLQAVFCPRSVAIIGASDDVRKWGGSVLNNIIDGGYNGTIYPVNPRGGTLFGIDSYASLADLPAAPDLALMAVGGAQVKGVLEECGERGVRAVVVLAAGFSEIGAEGAALEREIVEVAAKHHLTLVGPNCIGLISNQCSFHATGFLTLHPRRGPLSVVSQSGSLVPGTMFTCERNGIGLEKLISMGNEAQVTSFDVLEYLRDDPHTKGVMMYLEGIEDGGHFFEAARSTSFVKPVIVLRGGITEIGGKAAASHTGAMAGSAAVYQAVARQAGVITCRNVAQMVDMGACLTYLPLPKGRRVAVVTNGGGPGVLTADEASLNGLQLAEIPQDVISAIDELLPPFWSRRNPLDLVASAYGDKGLRIMELVTRCDTVDAVVVIGFIAVPTAVADERAKLACGEFDGFTPWEMSVLEHAADLMEETGKPIMMIPAAPLYTPVLDLGRTYSPVMLLSGGAAMRALDRMDWYRRFRESAGN